jgi:hypothetical protein
MSEWRSTAFVDLKQLAQLQVDNRIRYTEGTTEGPHSIAEALLITLHVEITLNTSASDNILRIIHACRKRRLKWVATLPLWDNNTEVWSPGMGVGRGANNPTL